MYSLQTMVRTLHKEAIQDIWETKPGQAWIEEIAIEEAFEVMLHYILLPVDAMNVHLDNMSLEKLQETENQKIADLEAMQEKMEKLLGKLGGLM